MKRKKASKKMLQPMRFRPTLFWDVDPKTIDPKKHARYVIERILDFGTDREVRWMWHFYDHLIIRRTVQESRVLHAKTKALWSLMV